MKKKSKKLVKEFEKAVAELHKATNLYVLVRGVEVPRAAIETINRQCSWWTWPHEKK